MFHWINLLLYFTFTLDLIWLSGKHGIIDTESETQEHVLTSLSSPSEFTSCLTFSSDIFSLYLNIHLQNLMANIGHLPSHLSFYSNRNKNIHIRNYWCYTHIMMMLSILWWWHQIKGGSVACTSAIGPSSSNSNIQQQNQQQYSPLEYWRLQPLTAWVLFALSGHFCTSW